MSHEATNVHSEYRPDVTVDFRGEKKLPYQLFGRLLETLTWWYQRHRQRTALADLDDRLLNDIGLTRADVAREVRKSFWQR